MREKRTERGILVGYLPAPPDFGAPPRFPEWREQQEEALVLTSESTNRISILNMPTGTGKTLFAYMYCLMTGSRGLILVETKGLADQYMNDVGVGSGGRLVDIRGGNNYHCPALDVGGQYHYLSRGRTTADVGPCKTGLSCKLRDAGCPYYDQLREAQRAQVVITNYANWLALGKARREDDPAGEILGKFDVLVLDEIHAADTKVSDSMTVEIQMQDLRRYLGVSVHDPPRDVEKVDDWFQWVRDIKRLQIAALTDAVTLLRFARDGGTLKTETLEEVRYLRRLGGSIELLCQVGQDGATTTSWLVDHQQSRNGKSTIIFQPKWPAPYIEQYLFRGVSKIIGMSATVTEHMMKYLGLMPGQYDFWEFDSTFPIENRLVYAIPAVFMRWGMPTKDLESWVRTIDTIAAKNHSTEKGILHTVSYERARLYQRLSTMKDRLLENTPDSTARTVDRFKSSRDPLILVSPSVATGYDFPDDQCRWQVVGKVPFPSTESRMVQERRKSDKSYTDFLAMNLIIQAVGRSTRNPSDWSVVYIIDAVFKDWYKRNRKLAPKTFHEQLRFVGSIPRVRR
jgi:ATP-dependent DNA helicase DinG